MSFKAKNLTYESQEPAFLRKLKNEFGGGNLLFHERPLARPRKRHSGDDDDDEPTYIDEESNSTVTKAQYEAMSKSGNSAVANGKGDITPKVHHDGEIGCASPGSPVVNSQLKKEKLAVIGSSGKRRIAKVIDHEVQHEHQKEDSTATKPKKQSFRKTKKVKLSFEEAATDL